MSKRIRKDDKEEIDKLYCNNDGSVTGSPHIYRKGKCEYCEKIMCINCEYECAGCGTLCCYECSRYNCPFTLCYGCGEYHFCYGCTEDKDDPVIDYHDGWCIKCKKDDSIDSTDSTDSTDSSDSSYSVESSYSTKPTEL